MFPNIAVNECRLQHETLVQEIVKAVCSATAQGFFYVHDKDEDEVQGQMQMETFIVTILMREVPRNRNQTGLD